MKKNGHQNSRLSHNYHDYTSCSGAQRTHKLDFLVQNNLFVLRNFIYYEYFTKLWEGGTNVAPGKRHIVVQCNNLFNKAIISHSEAEGNQRNIECYKNV